MNLDSALAWLIAHKDIIQEGGFITIVKPAELLKRTLPNAGLWCRPTPPCCAVRHLSERAGRLQSPQVFSVGILIGVIEMQATFRVSNNPVRAFVIAFAVIGTLLLGGAGGYVLRIIDTPVALSAPIVNAGPAIVTSVSATNDVSPNFASRALRLELADQKSQASSFPAAAPTKHGVRTTVQ